MAELATVEAVSARLFSAVGTPVYAILDGASIPDLLDRLYGDRPAFCNLYRGALKPDIAEVAPYLVRLEPRSAFAQWVIERGWGNHWGIFAQAPVDLNTLRRHFRRFLIVYDPDGKPLYFRYYDPRVLRVYLPTCTSDELATVFGPVQCYLLEDESPVRLLRLTAPAGALRQDRLALNLR
jgi:Domain of unknown function (DUF4123)